MNEMVLTKPASEDWEPPILEWDGDGYPTDETLEIVRNWPYDRPLALFHALSAGWFGGEDYIHPDEAVPRVWRISTAGWSGNEDLLEAMEENRMLWMQTYMAHKVGGHYLFDAKPSEGRVSVSMAAKEDR